MLYGIKEIFFMKCSVCGKKSEHCCKYSGAIYCPKHYQQYLKFGHVLDNNPRTTNDLNDFEIYGDTTKVFVYNRRCEKYGYFLIDTEDLEHIIDKKWRIWGTNIVTGNYKPKHLYRYILNISDSNVVVDHRDSNRLNNKKNNLRVTTQAKNVINKCLQSNNSSGIAGVYFDEKRNKWCSEIRFDNKKCFLGRHANFSDAVYVKYIAEINVFGEYRSIKNDLKILKIIEGCLNKDNLLRYVKKRLYERYCITINIE